MRETERKRTRERKVGAIVRKKGGGGGGAERQGLWTVKGKSTVPTESRAGEVRRCG